MTDSTSPTGATPDSTLPDDSDHDDERVVTGRAPLPGDDEGNPSATDGPTPDDHNAETSEDTQSGGPA